MERTAMTPVKLLADAVAKVESAPIRAWICRVVVESEAHMARCKGCGEKKYGYTDYCSPCKWGTRLGNRYASRNALLVEQVIPGKPGSVFCAWDKIGNVIAGPADTRHVILMALAELERE